jgi:hypothetical protein
MHLPTQKLLLLVVLVIVAVQSASLLIRFSSVMPFRRLLQPKPQVPLSGCGH